MKQKVPLYGNAMQPYERDFLLNSVLAGYYRIDIDGKKLKLKTQFNVDIMYEASEIYYDVYNQCKEDGIMDDDEIYKFVCDYHDWNEEEEKRLDIDIPKYIENCKVEMYKNYRTKDHFKKAIKYVLKAEEEHDKLYGTRHAFDYLSCHGTALFARHQFIIENSVFDHSGKLYELSPNELAKVMTVYNQKRLSEIKLRELSRTDPWRTTWGVGKKTQLFSSPAFELSDEQKRLVQWSIMYDNVYENPDCPSDTVLENDYLLDGWLLLKKRERAKDKKREEIEQKIGNNKNAEEVYVVAQKEDGTYDEELVKDVFDMNDEQSRRIINNRLDIVNKHGAVTQENFYDVQQELMMKSNRGRNAR